MFNDGLNINENDAQIKMNSTVKSFKFSIEMKHDRKKKSIYVVYSYSLSACVSYGCGIGSKIAVGNNPI